MDAGPGFEAAVPTTAGVGCRLTHLPGWYQRAELPLQIASLQSIPRAGLRPACPCGGARKVAKPHFLESIPGPYWCPAFAEKRRPVVVLRPSLAVRASACKPMPFGGLGACASKAPPHPPPSPARGRGSHARPPLRLAGEGVMRSPLSRVREGWGEGGCAPAKVLFLMSAPRTPPCGARPPRGFESSGKATLTQEERSLQSSRRVRTDFCSAPTPSTPFLCGE